jgi:hypothetical protein
MSRLEIEKSFNYKTDAHTKGSVTILPLAVL